MRITRSGAGRKSRRAAGFLLHTFLSPPKEKCERPLGRPVPIRAGVGASSPTGGWGLRLRAHWGLSARPQSPSDRHPNNRAPHRAASPSLAPVSARQAPPRGIAYGKVGVYRCKQGAFRSPPAPLRGVGVSTGREYVPAGASKGLPRGKTIGAARAAVHSACCFSDFKVLTTLSALVSISTISLQ